MNVRFQFKGRAHTEAHNLVVIDDHKSYFRHMLAPLACDTLCERYMDAKVQTTRGLLRDLDGTPQFVNALTHPLQSAPGIEALVSCCMVMFYAGRYRQSASVVTDSKLDRRCLLL